MEMFFSFILVSNFPPQSNCFPAYSQFPRQQLLLSRGGGGSGDRGSGEFPVIRGRPGGRAAHLHGRGKRTESRTILEFIRWKNFNSNLSDYEYEFK